jgi:primary-amine oxidase
MKSKIRCGQLIGLIAIVVPAKSSTAQTQACSTPYYVEQSFPIAGPEETRWKLCWQVLDGPNLVITGAWFRPAPAAPWIKIVYDARVSQLFVPYHAGSPRYLDIGYDFGSVPLDSANCVAPAGIVLGSNQEVCKEVRDRGLAWKHDALSRRGEELVLWSVMAASNYNYIVEWTFRDDGIIIGRVGATGQIAGTDAHVHGPIWRLDLDLNGACCDAVSRFKHTELGTHGIDAHQDILVEGGLQWDAKSFTMLEIRDQTLKNANGKNSEWHLMPAVSGIPEHNENFTKSTFWVTPYHWSEMLGEELQTYTAPYVAPAEAVLNKDIVVWYYGGLHHMIRDEDQSMTQLMWTGFMLKPANVWSKTPLFP